MYCSDARRSHQLRDAAMSGHDAWHSHARQHATTMCCFDARCSHVLPDAAVCGCAARRHSHVLRNAAMCRYEMCEAAMCCYDARHSHVLQDAAMLLGRETRPWAAATQLGAAMGDGRYECA